MKVCDIPGTYIPRYITVGYTRPILDIFYIYRRLQGHGFIVQAGSSETTDMYSPAAVHPVFFNQTVEICTRLLGVLTITLTNGVLRTYLFGKSATALDRMR